MGVDLSDYVNKFPTYWLKTPQIIWLQVSPSVFSVQWNELFFCPDELSMKDLQVEQRRHQLDASSQVGWFFFVFCFYISSDLSHKATRLAQVQYKEHLSSHSPPLSEIIGEIICTVIIPVSSNDWFTLVDCWIYFVYYDCLCENELANRWPIKLLAIIFRKFCFVYLFFCLLNSFIFGQYLKLPLTSVMDG